MPDDNAPPNRHDAPAALDQPAAAAQARKRQRAPKRMPRITTAIAAYLTEIEIINELHLSERAGKAAFRMWQMHPSFPKRDKITNRFWYPQIVQWLDRLHGVRANSDAPTVVLNPREGEHFNEWRAARKAGKATRNRRTGANLPATPNRLAPNVVAEIGPGRTRLRKNNISPVASIGTDPTAA